MIKTYMAKKEAVNPEWYHIDATDQIVGRLASRVATILMGKHKPTYTKHVDTGDFVVITNAEKICFSGKKWLQKNYYHHTLYPGGLISESAAEVLEKHPERILELAIKRMLPKTKLGNKMFKKLKIYAGSEHNHEAQQPKNLDVTSTRRK